MQEFRESKGQRSRIQWTVKKNLYKCVECGRRVSIIDPKTNTCPRCNDRKKTSVPEQPKKEVSENGKQQIDW